MPLNVLPPQPTQLIGRGCEVERACGYLRDNTVRLLTLTGPAGIGKTRLAIAVAALQVEALSDRVYFVDLSPVEDPGRVIAVLAEALDVPDDDTRPVIDRLACFLDKKEVLLVLDNLEQVAGAADDLATLLARTTGLKVLATSRLPLQVSWEQQFPVPPLELPPPTDRVNLDLLANCPSIALFVERARGIDPDFRLSEQNAWTVAEICARLDGLPLAIELAAARSKLLGPDAILDWLKQESGQPRLELLRCRRRDYPPRHQTLRTAIDWSYRLLSPDEQTIFGRLAVFAGGFTLNAAEIAYPSPDSLDLVESLVDQSLLVSASSADSAGETRLRMLQTIREYALEKLTAAGELDLMRCRHASWFVTLAEQADRESGGPAQPIWLARLQSEQDNLRAALSWSLDNEPEAALRLAGSLSWFWEIRGPYAEAEAWIETALARNPNAPLDRRAKALGAAGTMAWRRGNFARSAAFHEKSLALYREAGDSCGTALALNNLGVQMQNLGDVHSAVSYLKESLAVAREERETNIVVMALLNLGLMSLERHRPEEAQRWLEEAVAVCRQLQNRRFLVSALQNLGEALFYQGDLDRALQLHRESLVLARDLGGQVLLAFGLEEVGGVYAKQGNAVPATRLFGFAEALRQANGAPPQPNFRAQFYDPTIASLQAQLGTSVFRSLWAEGRSLSMDAAVTEALGPEVARPNEDAVEGEAATPASSAPPIGRLTRREREVAVLIAHGESNREIARQLIISEGTVITHVAHILKKLQFHSRAQVAAWVVSQGLPDAPSH